MAVASIEFDNPEAGNPSLWLFGLLVAVTLHMGLVAAVMLWRDNVVTELTPPGIVEVDLDGDPTRLSSQPTNEQPQAEKAAPPPSAENAPETKQPEEQQAQTETKQQTEPKTSPETPPTPIEAKSEPEQPKAALAEMVEPAPNTLPAPQPLTAPEVARVQAPEATLPKENETKKIEKEEPETKQPAPQIAKQETPKPPPPAKPKKEVKAPAPKSNSTKQTSAPAASRGRGSPSAVFTPHPAFPRSAQSRGISSGTVTVRYTISSTGSVSNVSVVSSRPSGVFDSETISAVSRWRFTGTGASVTKTQTFHFVLR